MAAFAAVLAAWWSVDSLMPDVGDPLTPAGRVRTGSEAPGAGPLAAAPTGSKHATRSPVIERPLETHAAAAGATGEEAVLVHGQVRRGGLPVRFYDLEFHLADGEADWDFTDDRGRFGVRLPAGAYVVRSETDPSWTRDLDVVAGDDECVLDIDLATWTTRLRSHVRAGE